MTKEQWAWVLRSAAAKAAPRFAVVLRELAEQNRTDPARVPGEEG